MAHQLKYLDAVDSDVQEAKVWYKEKRDGLEIEFARAIEMAIQKIIKMPTAYSIRYKNVRIAHAKIFPYNIHFYVDEVAGLIVITAIVHNKRHADVARNRV
jgi:plasmid stabilization system protein ParE